jgi:site-specific recombinase XerD
MTAISDRQYSRDVIERYLDRTWVFGRAPLHALAEYRSALNRLDDWMQRHRVTTLATASPTDLRALLDSAQWIEIAHGCETLLGLVAGFYQTLQDCKFRHDDPIETLVNQELFAAAIKRDATALLRHDLRRTSVA